MRVFNVRFAFSDPSSLSLFPHLVLTLLFSHSPARTVPASIITCASFAPSSTYTHLALSSDPIFSDGHSYLVPLRATLSGATLSAATTASSERLFAVRTGIEGGERGGGEGGVGNGARDAIVVVADGESPFSTFLFLLLVASYLLFLAVRRRARLTSFPFRR